MARLRREIVMPIELDDDEFLLDELMEAQKQEIGKEQELEEIRVRKTGLLSDIAFYEDQSDFIAHEKEKANGQDFDLDALAEHFFDNFLKLD